MQVILSVIIPFYEGSKKIMNENQNLIVDGNTIYEIDPECLKRKRKQQEEREETAKDNNSKE